MSLQNEIVESLWDAAITIVVTGVLAYLAFGGLWHVLLFAFLAYEIRAVGNMARFADIIRRRRGNDN